MNSFYFSDLKWNIFSKIFNNKKCKPQQVHKYFPFPWKLQSPPKPQLKLHHPSTPETLCGLLCGREGPRRGGLREGVFQNDFDFCFDTGHGGDKRPGPPSQQLLECCGKGTNLIVELREGHSSPFWLFGICRWLDIHSKEASMPVVGGGLIPGFVI